MRVGSYVKVISTPESWEGAGESDSDRLAFVGHIGIVVEAPSDKDDVVFVRFPTYHHYDKTGNRNFEQECLEVISEPFEALPVSCVEESM